jgi:type I restriction enzyme S subunit
MTAARPEVALGEVLHQCDTSMPSSDLTEVNLAGVYSFGRGLFRRGPMSPGKTSYRTYNRLVADDFVISMPKAWEGALARVTQDFDGWFLSPVFPCFRANRERLEPRYLEWFCRRSQTWTDLLSKAHGIGARRESVSPEQFLSLVIPLPPLPEQRRIVARVEELAGKVEEVKGLVVEAGAASDALVLSEMARVWGVLKSQYGGERLANLTVDASYGTSAKCGTDRQPGDVGVLRIPNIAAERVDLGNMKYTNLSARELDHLAVRLGDLLVVRTNGSRDLVGRCAVVSGTPEPTAFASYLIRVRVNEHRVRPDFAQRMMKKLRVDGTLVDFARTTAGQYNVSLGRLREAVLPVPPLEEQDRVVAELDALQAKVDELKRLQAEMQAELDALMPSILDRAFKGEL